MTILLAFWIGGSLVLCLTFLAVAARRVPSPNEESLIEPALRTRSSVPLELTPSQLLGPDVRRRTPHSRKRAVAPLRYQPLHKLQPEPSAVEA